MWLVPCLHSPPQRGTVRHPLPPASLQQKVLPIPGTLANLRAREQHLAVILIFLRMQVEHIFIRFRMTLVSLRVYSLFLSFAFFFIFAYLCLISLLMSL